MATEQRDLTREQFQEIKIKAIEHMSDLRLHRRLTLPPNPKAGRPNPLRVSYSDVGAIPFGGKYADPPALLLASPFMAGRLHAAAIGELARLWGVRAVCIDKPGIGGSDPVPLEQKIRVWLEIVVAVLDHLQIKHISVACHSAGAIYAANVLLHLRHLLEPVNYVAFLAPWVSPRHGSSKMMPLASLVPARVVAKLPAFIKFAEKLYPFLQASWYPFKDTTSEFLHRLKPHRKRRGRGQPSDDPPEASSVDMDELLNSEFRYRLSCLASKYADAEPRAGLGVEAQFCLKKGGGACVWGDWKDYDELVKLLVANETTCANPNKLRIDVFHATEDRMVGKRGQKWFDACWKEDILGRNIEYNATVIENTNHETIASEEAWVFDTILEQIAERTQRAQPDAVVAEDSDESSPHSSF